MASIFSRLRDAIFGRSEIEEQEQIIISTETEPSRSMIRFLKMLPTDDDKKKEELTKFFQTPAGSRYSSAERKQAYDELLGAHRNRDTIG